MRPTRGPHELRMRPYLAARLRHSPLVAGSLGFTRSRAKVWLIGLHEVEGLGTVASLDWRLARAVRAKDFGHRLKPPVVPEAGLTVRAALAFGYIFFGALCVTDYHLARGQAQRDGATPAVMQSRNAR